MSTHVDFAELYRRLGTGPNCSVQELTVAWRRQVAALHPDRGHTGSDDELQRLTAAYRAACAFEQRTGRLPGARSASPIPRSRRSAAIDAGESAPRPNRFRLPLILAALAAIAALWLVPDRSNPPPGTRSAPTAALPQARATVPSRITLGMRRDLVRQIEGAPAEQDRNRWLYGPSWVAFACDRVSGWYSSPLHPLEVSEASRPPVEPRDRRDCR